MIQQRGGGRNFSVMTFSMSHSQLKTVTRELAEAKLLRQNLIQRGILCAFPSGNTHCNKGTVSFEAFLNCNILAPSIMGTVI